MPKEQSSEELSSLAANVLQRDRTSGMTYDQLKHAYDNLLADAKRLAGSVLTQDETPEVEDGRAYPKFNAGDKVYIEKADITKTIVRAYDYHGEWAYVLEDDEGSQDEGWREDELRLEECE